MEKEELRKLAEGGNAEAWYKLGMTCLKRKFNEHGELVPQGVNEYPDENEYTEGIGWLERAAEAGYVKAQGVLGAILKGVSIKFERGGSIRKHDEAKSQYWEKLVAENGDKYTAWKLGQKYADWRGYWVRYDPKKSDFEKSILLV